MDGVLTRTEAIAKGLKVYFTGKPCKHGHISNRYTAKGTCVACALKASDSTSEYSKTWRLTNKDRLSKLNKKYSVLNKEKRAAQNKEWRKNNPDKCVAQRRNWDAANPDKRAKFSSQWRKENPEVMNAHKGKRRAAVILRYPKWITEDDVWLMKEVYDLANLRTVTFGVSWTVDHIIPLQGKKVSGLHVPTNLQVITRKANSSKSNIYEPN